MAPLHSFLLFVLSLVLCLSSLVSAAPWIVTEYYQDDGYTTTESWRGSAYATYTYTQIAQITPTATDVAAISTTTSIGTDYDDVTVVQILYPTGAGAQSTYDYYEGSSGYGTTDYYVELVYTAPTSCSSQWTTTTAVSVYVPYEINGILPATSIQTSISVNNDYAFQPVTYTMAMAYIDPTQIPASTLSSLSRYNAPTAGSSSCSLYSSDSDTGGYSNGYYNDYNYNWLYDDWWYGIAPLAIILIVVLGWFFLLFIIGLIENFVQFRRLMRGWRARRGLPIAWSLAVPLPSLLLLFFVRRGFRARSLEESEELKQKWNEMGFWTKIGLWLRWGFRFKYPPMLGPAPPKAKLNKRPLPAAAAAGATGAPLLQVTPPRSAGSENPSNASRDVENPPVLPEMSQLGSQRESLQVPQRTSRPREVQEQPASPASALPRIPEDTPAASQQGHPTQQDDDTTDAPSDRPQNRRQ